MAKCFCGCRLPVKGFAARGQNKQGRRTVEQVEKLKALKIRCLNLAEGYEGLEDALPGTNIGATGQKSAEALSELAESFDDLIETGETYSIRWHDIVHLGEIPPEGVMTYKKTWFSWGKAAMAVTPMLKVSDEKLTDFALAYAADDTPF